VSYLDADRQSALRRSVKMRDVRDERAEPVATELERVATEAINSDGIGSAVIFLVRGDPPVLELAAAAGVDGPALEGLVAAVRNPAHPIARTAVDGTAAFNVQPTAPGGPALRSHIPILTRTDPDAHVAGVLAVAHEPRLEDAAKTRLQHLVEVAGQTLD
jgi:hypothetical protein